MGDVSHKSVIEIRRYPLGKVLSLQEGAGLCGRSGKVR
jgi:hypothetical protein